MASAVTFESSPLLPLRACDLCEHGITIGSIRHCVCADVMLPEQLPRSAATPVPVRQAREATGPCGWEARHMRTWFLQPAG